eukprot:85558-Chlamydomonas_euryale.AAC.2
MPVLSAARQRGSISGLGAVTKGMPLRKVLSHPVPTTVSSKKTKEGRVQGKRKGPQGLERVTRAGRGHKI